MLLLLACLTFGFIGSMAGAMFGNAGAIIGGVGGLLLPITYVLEEIYKSLKAK